jgi:sulfhydrogenase subunit beta (sulfur reductase)
MAYLLKKEDFGLFVKLLMKSYDVIAPIKKKKLIVFSEIKSHKEIELDKNSFYPPKKFFLPQKEELFDYKEKKNLLGTKRDVINTIYHNKKKVILGMRMCDVSAVNKMDKFYLGEEEDPYYKERRENTFIIGMKCNSEENDNCFCSSFEHKDTGYDLFIEKTEEGFIVDVSTPKGKSLIDKKIFKASVREVNKDLPVCNKILETKDVPQDSLKWKNHAEKCLSCSACNVVCPTCGCFDIKDYPNLDLKSGKRFRIWDYCQSADYTRVAGNHIFRQGRVERFKHRLLCKFKYFKDNYKETTCTGCGRCVTVCPSDICDIPKVINDINK